eukprot:GHVU01052259.1.p1 GENE.GHVU01052259.1~~GHVU01052259.1.p1  ORF type:complete len:135 (-),score=0.30 GHVU01052259.1:174-578(-)
MAAPEGVARERHMYGKQYVIEFASERAVCFHSLERHKASRQKALYDIQAIRTKTELLVRGKRIPVGMRQASRQASEHQLWPCYCSCACVMQTHPYTKRIDAPLSKATCLSICLCGCLLVYSFNLFLVHLPVSAA